MENHNAKRDKSKLIVKSLTQLTLRKIADEKLM